MEKSLLTIKLIAISCLIILTIASCKKTSSTSSTPSGAYNISFSNGGTATTYPTRATAVIPSEGICVLSALSSDGDTIITINVENFTALSTNITYTDTSLVNTAEFQINTTTGTLTLIGLSSYASTPNSLLNAKLNFSEITSKYVRGTFSGNMAITPYGTATVVSNGTFYLPIE